MGSGILRFTPIYAGLLGMLVVFLAVHVVKFRRAEKIGVGLGSEAMQRAIRAHANALENIPIGLLLLLMLELNHLTPWLLNTLGIAFLCPEPCMLGE